MYKIKEARQKAGLTQTELAEKIGVSKQLISLYELEKREPKLDKWQKLSTALGVSVPYLQGLESSAASELMSKQLREFEKTHPNHDDQIQFMRLLMLNNIDASEAAGWEYEKNLNDKQLDTLLDTVSAVYDTWLAYMPDVNSNDSKIDEFFGLYNSLIRNLYFLALSVGDPEEKGKHITFGDLVELVLPFKEQSEKILLEVSPSMFHDDNTSPVK